MAGQTWYRASDGRWYFGNDTRPYVAPPIPDGVGGWYAAVPLSPAPAKRSVPLWAKLVGGLTALLLVGAAVDSSESPDTAPSAAERAPLTAVPPATERPDPTTLPPAPKRVTPTPRPTTPPAVRVAPTRKPVTRKPVPVRPVAPVLDPHYGTCREAIANGYGPYYRGQDPEYDWYTDRDSDGVVCER